MAHSSRKRGLQSPRAGSPRARPGGSEGTSKAPGGGGGVPSLQLPPITAPSAGEEQIKNHQLWQLLLLSGVFEDEDREYASPTLYAEARRAMRPFSPLHMHAAQIGAANRRLGAFAVPVMGPQHGRRHGSRD